MKINLRKASLAVLFVAGVMIASGIQEATAMLLGTRGFGSGANSVLVEIDPATGATIRTIGPVGYTVNGLEYDATTEKLYGSTSVHDANYNGLIEIDPNTGAGTPIGVHGWGRDRPMAVTNITVNSTGQMFGWWEPEQDDLMSIDKGTGIATRVGESGLDTYENGLSFDPKDILYMVDGQGAVYTIDTVTGAATPAGSISPDAPNAHHGDFDPASGLYYGITWGLDSTRSLVVADLSTGTATILPLEEGDLHTLTFMSKETVSIDIKPGSCPNPINVRKKEDSKSVLPVAILGIEDLDVNDVDLTSLQLEVTGPNGTFTVPVIPNQSVIADVAAPAPEDADCFEIEYDLDGSEDVTVYFYIIALIDAIVDAGIALEDGVDVTVVLSGQLTSGVAITGEDVIVLGVKGNMAPSKHNTLAAKWGEIKSR